MEHDNNVCGTDVENYKDFNDYDYDDYDDYDNYKVQIPLQVLIQALMVAALVTTVQAHHRKFLRNLRGSRGSQYSIITQCRQVLNLDICTLERNQMKF